MALELPRLVVTRRGGAPPDVDDPTDALHLDELAPLAHLDDAPLGDAPAYRVRPLAGDRTVVGRRAGETTVWRVVDEATHRRIGHPAWLWTDPRWFDPADEGSLSAPVVLPLRHLLRNAAPLGGGHRGTVEALASTCGALRLQRGPVAVQVPAGSAAAEDGRARWFALALLTILPVPWRRRLRVAVGEVDPRPSDWDLVIGASVPEGFVTVDAGVPDARDSSDLVVSFLRDRLLANEPEAVEAAAFLYDGRGADPWGEGVRRHLAAGVPGVSDLDPEVLKADPERAVRSVLWRIQAGAPVDGELAADLAAVTGRTGDTGPWRALAGRAPEELARALEAWLALDPFPAPRAELVDAIAALEPAGPARARWTEALFRLLELPDQRDRALDHLEGLLDARAEQLPLPVLASLWTEWLRATVAAGAIERAADALLGPIGILLARAGAGEVLVHGWLALPDRVRSGPLVRELVDRLADAPNAEETVALLLALADRDGLQDGAALVVQRWVRRRAEAGEPAAGLVATLVRETAHREAWVEAAAVNADDAELAHWVEAVAHGPHDPLWGEAVRERTGSVRERLLALPPLLEQAREPVEDGARDLLGDLLAATSFPDADVAEMAALLAEVPESSPMWRWLAVTAAAPDQLDDETIDATVVAFCAEPPTDPAARAFALGCVQKLGAARGYTPLELARWVVRLVLSPDADGRGLPLELARHLVRGMADGEDGPDVLAAVTVHLAELDDHHPALVAFLDDLLPNAWTDAVPRRYRDAVNAAGLRPPLRRRWRAALEGR